jgi:hypothetical protein
MIKILNVFQKKFFLSIISVINLNLEILIIKIKSKKKIIFFYHPEKDLTSISLNYINFFFKDNINFKIFYGHSFFKIKKKKYFYINQKFLKFLFGIDFFISSYINDIFPNNCTKIYLHHDIYDTPLVKRDHEKFIFSKILKYNIIFVSSEKIKKEFIKKLKKLFFNNSDLKIFVTGYLKLQYLLMRKKNHRFKNNKNIIIAPTNFLGWKKYSLIDKLEEIILELLNNTKFNLYLRFHPSNRENFIAKKILNKFKKNPKFHIDNSDDYFSTYINSRLMITDMSGTAYTYAFLTKNPVIFISNMSQNYSTKSYYKNLNYFSDRNKIGLVTDNFKKLSNKVNGILSKKKFPNKINYLRKQVFDYQNQPYNKIKKILEKLKN